MQIQGLNSSIRKPAFSSIDDLPLELRKLLVKHERALGQLEEKLVRARNKHDQIEALLRSREVLANCSEIA